MLGHDHEGGAVDALGEVGGELPVPVEVAVVLDRRGDGAEWGELLGVPIDRRRVEHLGAVRGRAEEHGLEPCPHV